MLGYDYPILGLFWTIFMIFIWVAWLVLVFNVISDIFRHNGLGGWGKAFWTLFVIVLPWLGVLVYLIVHGRGMEERNIERAQAQQAAVNSYIRDAAGGGASAADEITKLAALRDQGLLTEAEFAAQKSKLLA